MSQQDNLQRQIQGTTLSDKGDNKAWQYLTKGGLIGSIIFLLVAVLKRERFRPSMVLFVFFVVTAFLGYVAALDGDCDEAIDACVKLTNRYITDRFLPDKAINALDEAGSRVHIVNMDVPKQILELEKELDEVRELKNSVVKKQRYEEAAKLRDDEKRLEKDLSIAQEKWEEDSKLHRETVDADNVADVVSCDLARLLVKLMV